MTLTETALAAMFFCMVALVMQTFFLGGNSANARSVESNTAVQSALQALESIRRDASQMVYRKARDLVIQKRGHGVAMLISAPTESDDRWHVSTRCVQYQLKPASRRSNTYHLVRTVGDKPAPLLGCLLQDLKIAYIPPGRASALQAYLQVSVVGAGSTGARGGYAASEMIPVTRTDLPKGYVLP